jgi:hypothetical protein
MRRGTAALSTFRCSQLNSKAADVRRGRERWMCVQQLVGDGQQLSDGEEEVGREADEKRKCGRGRRRAEGGGRREVCGVAINESG